MSGRAVSSRGVGGGGGKGGGNRWEHDQIPVNLAVKLFYGRQNFKTLYTVDGKSCTTKKMWGPQTIAKWVYKLVNYGL